MSAWVVDSPQQLALDGDVTELRVWLTSGKLRVVGTDGPARLDVTKIGSKGISVTLEGEVLSVRHELPRTWRRFLSFWWFCRVGGSTTRTSRSRCRRPRWPT